MLSLPIDNIKSKFLQILPKHHIVVEAETGSGKSTKLPLWASEHGRVLVIEPRRIACTSLATYLAKQNGSELGDNIGYAIKLESCFNIETNIVFVTPGVALRWFYDDRLAEFDIVLVDEFHERRWDTDLLVALLQKTQVHRLIITSATIEGDKLARYIGAKRLVAQGRQYNVRLVYRSLDSHYLPDNKNCIQNAVNCVKSVYQDTPGDILVFMPGRNEITQCVQSLSKLDDVEVVMLHASVSDNERHRALTQLNKKKIVVATNVAETSLTIPNITLVIDSGLERRTLQRNGRTVLSLKSISKASAKQRSGRAGRVMDGECIRLYGEHAPLELVTPPELLREELSEAMLASACCGFELCELTFLDALPEKSLTQAKLVLIKMAAIDDNGVVTEHGRRLYPLPIDTLYADLLTRMPCKATKEAMLDLAAALSVPAALYQLPSDEHGLNKIAQWEPNSCDAEILIKIVRGDIQDNIQLEMDAVKEARRLAQQMRRVFHLPELEVASRFKRVEFVSAIAENHPELVFVRRKKRRQALGNGLIEMVPARNSRFSDGDEAAIVLDQHSLPGKGVKQTLNLATVMLPIPLNLIARLGLGEWEQGKTTVVEGQLYSQLSLVFAGREIMNRLVEPVGDLLLKPLLEAVLKQKVLPGFANKRRQEIDHWCLFTELGLDERYSGPQSLTFESWFIRQLKDLGVDKLDELLLFCEDDLLFEGIPYWEYDDFSQKYPFRLNLGDLHLKVEYVPNKKRVYILYESGLRKSEPKRWELPIWSGWRIQYKKSSRIVDIK